MNNSTSVLLMTYLAWKIQILSHQVVVGGVSEAFKPFYMTALKFKCFFHRNLPEIWSCHIVTCARIQLSTEGYRSPFTKGPCMIEVVKSRKKKCVENETEKVNKREKTISAKFLKNRARNVVREYFPLRTRIQLALLTP